MTKVHNFSAGPCILPQEVLKQASEAVVNFNELDLSLIEISHRSKDFVEVMENARSLVKELLNIPDGYQVVFLQGGASLGFLMAAYNFLSEGETAAYINTGAWAGKAIKEAQRIGNVNVVASSEDKNFNYIPKGFGIPSDAKYLHFTSNNTIFGTQFKKYPISRIPLLCDMSSDIFSKEIEVNKFDLIYAGAQKNMGPAGTTLYIVKESALGKTGNDIPTMLDLRTHIKKDSMFNTPPVFPIFVSMLTLQWLKKNGGVKWIQSINEQKAKTLYDEIDRNPLFEGVTEKEDRSTMNATFVLKDDQQKETFDEMWKAANISGINGHRSVGGYRASMYNALPLESVQALVDVMKELERTKG
ncbi:MAG: 3-phosphoserine/phosphohydroxythreonine aminotransferase [Verrucomicrobia bacterium]|nr:3-phosphoserine/phosphohydroxythreonine aminotransferase [Verrucomicrobiota bacterium]|tara:strand:- start:427 stop:1500 length:1074 start_codon:yes stop_codon:yes gene_type:complete